MRIELEGAIVRSWQEEDAEAVAAHADDRDIWIQLRDLFPHPYSVSDARAYIEHVQASDPETSFAIEVEGEAAGGIGVTLGQDIERTGAEVGYWLGRKYWGRGITTAALIAMRDYALERYALTRIWAVPLERNAASLRVLERAGFACEGRLRRSAIKDGKVLDQLMYAYVR